MSNQQISVEPLGLNNNKHTLLLDKISTGSQLSKREFESVMTQIRAFKIRTFYFIQKYSKVYIDIEEWEDAEDCPLVFLFRAASLAQLTTVLLEKYTKSKTAKLTEPDLTYFVSYLNVLRELSHHLKHKNGLLISFEEDLQ